MSSASPGESAMEMIREGWDHLRSRRPLAAWASWQRASRIDPESEAAAKALERLEKSADLPTAARTVYRLRTPADPARRAAWNDRLGPAVGNGRGAIVDADLAAMADAFGRLAEGTPEDVAARYNQALCLAWQGANRPAIQVLRAVVRDEAVSSLAGAIGAWILAEVLRAGAGAEEFADDLRFACTIPWEPPDTAELLREFPGIRPLPTPHPPGAEDVGDRGIELFEWLERPPSEAETPTVVLASVIVDPASRSLRLSSPRIELLQQAEERLLSRLGLDAEGRPLRGETRRGLLVRREAEPLPFPFLDADVWTVRMPAVLDPSAADTLRRDWVEHYHEDIWIHRVRRSLDDRTPMAVAWASHRGDAESRAMLAAAVDFREQLGRRPAAAGLYQGYPFDRLRRRLGLELSEPEAVDRADLSCAPPWELVELDPAALDDHRLRDAVASAVGLRDDPLAATMAAALLDRAIPIDGPTLLEAVSSLIRRSLGRDDFDGAVDSIARARRLADPSSAETLEVWRAEILARAGRPAESLGVYQALISADAAGAALALDGADTMLDNGHAGEALALLRSAGELARTSGLTWTLHRAEERIEDLG